MKNDDIKKIRQLFKSIEWIHVAFHENDYFCPYCKRSKEDGHHKDCRLEQTLALFSCETCGGAGRITGIGTHFEFTTSRPCPDCQP